MKSKTFWAITKNQESVLVLNQSSAVDVDIFEVDDIGAASFFSSKEGAANTILEISGKTDSQWQYSCSYNIDELDLVEVVMNYRVIDKS